MNSAGTGKESKLDRAVSLLTFHDGIQQIDLSNDRSDNNEDDIFADLPPAW